MTFINFVLEMYIFKLNFRLNARWSILYLKVSYMILSKEIWPYCCYLFCFWTIRISLEKLNFFKLCIRSVAFDYSIFIKRNTTRESVVTRSVHSLIVSWESNLGPVAVRSKLVMPREMFQWRVKSFFCGGCVLMWWWCIFFVGPFGF